MFVFTRRAHVYLHCDLYKRHARKNLCEQAMALAMLWFYLYLVKKVAEFF